MGGEWRTAASGELGERKRGMRRMEEELERSEVECGIEVERVRHVSLLSGA